MKRLVSLLAVITLFCLLFGCAGKDTYNHGHADLINFGPGKTDVLITSRCWAGFWGPEGYIGHQNEHYRAGLRGNGSTFIDPIFQDNPPDIHCIGSITLDRQHKKVILNMRRIISKSGEPLRTAAHPANGTYMIESGRDAQPGEPSL